MFKLLIKIGCAVVLLTAFLLQGCGTYLHGTRQDLDITTIPAGVTVTITNESCTTPCFLNVPRKARYITLEKGAYREEYILDKKINYVTTILGNLIWLYP